MFPTAMSHSPSLSEEDATVSSGTRVQNLGGLNHVVTTIAPQQQPQKMKKKRSLPGNPDPDAEVIALSPKTLLATNRFVCEICHKGFQREQNLQLHRRGHNLPWKLKQRSKEAKKKAYVCPEPSCVHHSPSRALGDLTGIKKHYCRKHGEKKWKCDKCSKIYAVQSDWKAHSKTCGTREYRCDCGTLFSRKDSFVTHRAFCDALAEESARLSATQLATSTNPLLLHSLFLFPTQKQNFHNHITNFSPSWDSSHENPNPSIINIASAIHIKPEAQTFHINDSTTFSSPPTLLRHPHSHHEHHHHKHVTASNLHVPSSNAATSATALLQKAATVGAITGPGSSATFGVGVVQQQHSTGHVTRLGMVEFGTVSQLDSVMGMRELKSDRLTRDFLGLTVDANGGSGGGVVDVSMDGKNMLTYTGGVEYHHQAHRHIRQRSMLNPRQGFGFFGTNSAPETWGNC